MSKKQSLQWKLTLITCALVTVACLLLSFWLSRSATSYMEDLGDSVIAVFPIDSMNSNVSTSDIRLEFSLDVNTQVQHTQSEFWTTAMLVTVLIVLSSGTLTYVCVGHVLRPLHDLSKEIRDVQDRNLQNPITVNSASAEIKAITHAFNDMLDRISQAFSAQKQFSANAAHELRTPLAIIQSKLDIFEKEHEHTKEEYADTLRMVRTQTERLSGVIDVLLELTRLQTAKRNDTILLAELCEEVVCDLTSLAKDKNITLLTEFREVSVTGNEVLVYRSLYNLLENAIKYNRPGGSVKLKIHTDSRFAYVSVQDTGNGIAEDDREKIFDPFFRVDSSGNRAMGGAGLGLALVKEIAVLHGGDVGIEESSVTGTTFRISFSVRNV